MWSVASWVVLAEQLWGFSTRQDVRGGPVWVCGSGGPHGAALGWKVLRAAFCVLFLKVRGQEMLMEKGGEMCVSS